MSLSAQLAQAVFDAVEAARPDAPFAVGVVQTAPASGPITVLWDDAVCEARRLSGYTPVVGDVVLMARPPNQLVVLGRIV